jgi:uncharacterized protein (TIGR01777 family)
MPMVPDKGKIMKVLMTGGTGFLGTALRKRLEESGHSITAISRSRLGTQEATTFVPNDALPKLEPHDVVINLAGESVAGLWTRRKREAIYHSRIDTTRALAEWIEKSAVKPSVFLSGSAVGIYGDAADEELTERTDVSRAQGFLARVCRDWEQAASGAAWRGTRTVLLRTGQVLDPSGGFLGTVLPIMRRFPIVILGPRTSWFPWIALQDWVSLAVLAIENESISGPLNLSSPQPVTQEQLTAAIAGKLGKKVWGRVPKWALKLGAGEFGEAMCFSERAVPEKALLAGFPFQFVELGEYLRQTQL